MAFEHVVAGQRWHPKDIELNAMLDAGRQHAASQGVTPPGQLQSGRVYGPLVVRVKNATGAAVERYRAYSLGDAVYELSATRSIPEIAFELIAYSSERTVAVTQVPIVSGGMGYAVVNGMTLLELISSGDANAWSAQPLSSGLAKAGTGTIRLTQQQPTGGGVVLAVLGVSSGSALIAFPPGGGIPAAVWDGTTLTLGSAVCNKAQRSGNNVTVLADEITVYNTTTAAVGTNGPVQCKLSGDGLWLVDVEICSPGTPEPIPAPPDLPVDQDLDLAIEV
jgi:hypothetical protein